MSAGGGCGVAVTIAIGDDNIGVAEIKNNCILHQDSKTKAELLDHELRSVSTTDDDIGHLPTMSHPK